MNCFKGGVCGKSSDHFEMSGRELVVPRSEVAGCVDVDGFKAQLDALASAEDGFWDEFTRTCQAVENHHSYLGRLTQSTPEVRKRNRYPNIICLEDTRVKLKDGRCDYINASVVDMGDYKYIAAQAPLVNTIEHFWQMCWENNVPCVAMLTQWVEHDRVKADKYFPLLCDTKVEYGNFVIECKDIDKSEESRGLVLRKFLFSKGSESRTISHVHFSKWPDFGSVENMDLYLSVHSMIRQATDGIRADMSMLDGPLVVHCSAGIGRTGTYIAVETILRDISSACIGDRNGRYKLDIPAVLGKLRNCRPGMVFSSEQYKMVYEVIYWVVIGDRLGSSSNGSKRDRASLLASTKTDAEVYKRGARR